MGMTCPAFPQDGAEVVSLEQIIMGLLRMLVLFMHIGVGVLLRMMWKMDERLVRFQNSWDFFRAVGQKPARNETSKNDEGQWDARRDRIDLRGW